jgi:hypothetical protein
MPMTDKELEDMKADLENLQLLVPDLVYENRKGEEEIVPPGPSLREMLEAEIGLKT